jgi:hypothetical protein
MAFFSLGGGCMVASLWVLSVRAVSESGNIVPGRSFPAPDSLAELLAAGFNVSMLHVDPDIYLFEQFLSPDEVSCTYVTLASLARVGGVRCAAPLSTWQRQFTIGSDFFCGILYQKRTQLPGSRHRQNRRAYARAVYRRRQSCRLRLPNLFHRVVNCNIS